MPRHLPADRRATATFALKLGRTLEANATGWGVLAVPVVLLLVLAAGLIGLLCR